MPAEPTAAQLLETAVALADAHLANLHLPSISFNSAAKKIHEAFVRGHLTGYTAGYQALVDYQTSLSARLQAGPQPLS